MNLLELGENPRCWSYSFGQMCNQASAARRHVVVKVLTVFTQYPEREQEDEEAEDVSKEDDALGKR